MNLEEHLKRQMAFSISTYGPGTRTEGVIDHIRKETVEVLEEGDPREWVDLVILSLDGLWRSLAFTGENNWDDVSKIAAQLILEKQSRNEQRNWPDWRNADPNKAIEHDRSSD